MNMRIPIVVAFTENYVVPAVTCLSSLIKNSESKYKFEIICLLTKELPVHLQELLTSFAPDRLSFRFISLEGALDGVYVDERYTIAASYRLLLPNILKEYDKVIYTDCDVIIRNDLGKLYYETDLKDNYLAAVYEATLDFQISYLKEIGCEPGFYFNSGFLIMNLKQMRVENLTEKLIEGLRVPYLQFPDQDVLNIYCQGRVLALAPIYNSIRTFFLQQYQTEFLRKYSKSDWVKVQKHGTIHYTGGKPWNEVTIKFEEWWHYYLALPDAYKQLWKGNPKLEFFAKVILTPVLGSLYGKSLQVFRYIKNYKFQ